MLRLATVLALSCVIGANVYADVIDPFTASQGPIEVGPGEEPSQDEAILETTTVLGGFRILVPAIDDEAPANAVGRAEISGGEFHCDLSANGGCSSGYDRGEDDFFDLSASSAFEIDVIDASPSLSLGITVVDADEKLALGLLETVSPGMRSIPFEQLVSPVPGQSIDLSRVDSLSVTAVSSNDSNAERFAIIGRFATDGPIGRSDPGGPPDDGDDPAPLSGLITGTYFDPSRDGEGCQLSREADDQTFVLTCYTYRDGKQVWLLGVGELLDTRLIASDVIVTRGTGFGSAFNPDDVIEEEWGTIVMSFDDCNNAELALNPTAPGFEATVWNHTRVVAGDCQEDNPQAGASGTYFDPLRSGEGLQLVRQPGGSTYAATLYTYQDGEQAWILGVGERQNNRIVFQDAIITSGTGFGSAFDPEQIEEQTWGRMEVDISNCNDISLSLQPAIDGFEAIDLSLTRVLPFESCP